VAVRRPATEPLCRVVRFEATDEVPLAGLLYEPKRATKQAAVFLHGTGGASVFEARRTNLLGEAFARSGIAFFPFNNRGAHLMRRMGRVLGGMAYERIRDCVPDIDGAIRELWRRGYREITLIGHSTGANKVAVYDARKPRNRAKRYVLLAGGDDTGMLYDQLGARKFASALKEAREKKNSEDFVPRTLSSLPMTWRAWYDMANPDGDYNVFPFLEVMRNVRLSRRTRFRHVKSIRKPALVLYGENDEYMYGDVSRCVAILADVAGPNCELAIVQDADHGFGGKEEELAALIIDWIRR